MGFDAKHFVAPLDSGLVCGICTGVFDDLVSACADGHPFCRGCLKKAKKCPVDNKALRKTITAAPPFLTGAIDKMQLRCANHKDVVSAKRLRDGAPVGRTCDWVGACCDFKSHQQSCAAVLVDCPLGCGATLARGDAAAHTQTVCGLRNVACPDCKAVVKAANLAMHAATCPEKVVECGEPGCDVRTKRNQLVGHRGTCAHLRVRCS
jgi:hypothetical protein